VAKAILSAADRFLVEVYRVSGGLAWTEARSHASG
jgi:hypothetical protein